MSHLHRLGWPVTESISIAIVSCAILSALPATASAQDLDIVFADWNRLNSSITTIDCSASVESFHPKGRLSEEYNEGVPENRKVKSPIPSTDTRISDGHVRWVLDLKTPRFRKEIRLTTAHFLREGPQLLPEHSIHIWNKEKYRIFRPREANWGANDRDDKQRHPDAQFYEGQAHEFVFGFSDLPMAWLGGSVSGQLLIPKNFRRTEPPARWTYVGEAEHRGQKCRIMTVPNQRDKDSVVEFWVAKQPGSPIVLCRAKEKSKPILHWSIDVENKAISDRPVLSKWTYTQYEIVTQRIDFSRTYTVQQLEINADLSDSLFDHQPSPGMVVRLMKDGNLATVDSDGSLIPYSQQRSWRWWPWVLGLILFSMLILTVILGRRRLASRRK